MQLTFYIAYIVGFVCATGFAVRYAVLTRGAWRDHQAGVSLMGMAVALAVTLGATTVRVVFIRMLGWAWADVPTIWAAFAGLVAVIAFIIHRWYLLERYQRSDKE